MENATDKSGRTVRVRKEITIENPFSLKVGEVFTGFGVGCGIGIGVGRPLNIGAIPMLNQVMVATRGATDVFSGVGRHVNTSLRKIGAKNMEAGIGCGVGFGRGFGVGLALKPWAIRKFQLSLVLALATVLNKLGIRTVVEQSNQNPLASFSNNASQSSRTDTVISNFLQNPVLKYEDGGINEMVMRHQKLIEKLMQEKLKMSSCDACFECRRIQRRR